MDKKNEREDRYDFEGEDCQASREQAGVADLAQHYQLHLNRIHAWKKQATIGRSLNARAA